MERWSVFIAAKELVQTREQIITSYPAADSLLRTYRSEMKASGICFFLEGSEIRKTVLSDEKFERVIKFALEMMEDEVLRVDVPGRKYIQLRSMCAQKKLFLKFTYSSERDLTANNRYFESLQTILDKCAGYIHVENHEYDNIVMIAIPVK